jgi:hypothetical protein
MKVLLHLNCVWKQFHIFFSHPVCWRCSRAQLWHDSQTFWDSASMPAQQTECFLVIWKTSCYWQHSSYCWSHSQLLQINIVPWMVKVVSSPCRAVLVAAKHCGKHLSAALPRWRLNSPSYYENGRCWAIVR